MITIVCLVGLACQEADWKRENFAGPVPEEIARGKNGRLELIGILGSRRWRHGDIVNSVAFNPDGRRALSGCNDTTLKLWEVESGRELDSIVVDGAPLDIAVHGDRALVGNLNGTVTVYRWK